MITGDPAAALLPHLHGRRFRVVPTCFRAYGRRGVAYSRRWLAACLHSTKRCRTGPVVSTVMQLPVQPFCLLFLSLPGGGAAAASIRHQGRRPGIGDRAARRTARTARSKQGRHMEAHRTAECQPGQLRSDTETAFAACCGRYGCRRLGGRLAVHPMAARREAGSMPCKSGTGRLTGVHGSGHGRR